MAAWYKIYTYFILYAMFLMASNACVCGTKSFAWAFSIGYFDSHFVFSFVG
jgi:hypothetical protein